MPRVSVVVATYKGAHLRETLSSIAAQTFGDFEALVLDDADESRCRKLVAEFDNRFVYRGNPINLGPARNHVSGIRDARGEMTAFLNHDDLWEPTALEALHAPLAREPDVVASFSQARVALADGTYSPERTAAARRTWQEEGVPVGRIDDWFAVSAQRPSIPAVPATMFRTEVGRAIRIPKIVGDAYDHWLGYRLARLGPVFHVAETVGYWREHEANLTSQWSPRRRLQGAFTAAVVAMDTRAPRAMRVDHARQIPRQAAGLVRDGGRTLTSRLSR